MNDIDRYAVNRIPNLPDESLKQGRNIVGCLDSKFVFKHTPTPTPTPTPTHDFSGVAGSKTSERPRFWGV